MSALIQNAGARWREFQVSYQKPGWLVGWVAALAMVCAWWPADAAMAKAKSDNWFADSRGCRLYAKGAARQRLVELAAHGTVTWDGRCVKGFINGAGVLRQEGNISVNGRAKRYMYYLSGRAEKGRRVGEWRRETLERFVDSPKVWTSLSTQNFVGGEVRGKPKLIKVRADSQYSELFVRKVLVPERNREVAALVAGAPPDLQVSEAVPVLKLASATSLGVLAPTPGEIQTAPASILPGLQSVAAPTPVVQPAAPTPAVPVPPTPVASKLTPLPAPVNITLRTAPERPARLSDTPPAFAQLERLQPGGACHVDALNTTPWGSEVVTVADTSSIRVSGWAFDDVARRLAKATVLVLEGADGRGWFAPTRPVDRPDVADFFKAPGVKGAGYSTVFSAEGLPAGDYEAALVMDAGERTLLCATGRRLRL